MCETVEKNCKNCEWLMYYDGYFCDKSDSEVSMKDFIEDIENETCQGFQERNGKFWLNEEDPILKKGGFSTKREKEMRELRKKLKLAIDGMTHGELLHLSEEAFNGADRCEECLAEIDGINTGEPRWCEDCR